MQEFDFDAIISKYQENLRMIREYKEDIKSYYHSHCAYQSNLRVDASGEIIIYAPQDFDKHYSNLKKSVSNYIDFIEKVNKTPINTSTMSDHLLSLITEFYQGIKQIPLYYDYTPDFIFDYVSYHDYVTNYYSILLLREFSVTGKNVVLIGGNGSGKSTLAQALKGKDRSKISVIPAQKTLYFSLHDNSLFSSRIEEVRRLLLEDNIGRSKGVHDYDYLHFQNNQFTKLIMAMREEHFSYLLECEKTNEISKPDMTMYGKLKTIFSIIFPSINLELSNTNAQEVLIASKNEQEYHLNAMSEGEKASIYYILSVLTADPDSFIVVDEPETYLNPSISNTLWDLLIEARQDCQFIFITHTIDFVLGRNNTDLYWIKNYSYPNDWNFMSIDTDTFPLPRNLMTEILGSKKDLLFCEGNDKDSLDYKVYQYLFGNKYTVLPVGGHQEVIKFTVVASSPRYYELNSIGIIDRDNKDQTEIEKLEKKNIFTIPFNEIEMLLLCDEVIDSTLMRIFNNTDKKPEFIKKFWEAANKDIVRMCLDKLKIALERKIQTSHIIKYSSLESIEESLERLSSYNARDDYDEIHKEITEVLEMQDYNRLLEICNLKKAISAQLANQYLDSNYEEKALISIQSDNELRDKLIRTYFSSVPNMNN